MQETNGASLLESLQTYFAWDDATADKVLCKYVRFCSLRTFGWMKPQASDPAPGTKLHPIGDIAKRSAQNHRQRNLIAARFLLANPPGNAGRDRRSDRDQQPAMRVVLRLGKAKADPVIMHPGQVEDGQQLDLLALELER